MDFTPKDSAMVTKASGITSTVNLLRVRSKAPPFPNKLFMNLMNVK